jgi:type IX secretion system substrate protein/Big-like domain-containing protein/NHL repeat-containing protein
LSDKIIFTLQKKNKYIYISKFLFLNCFAYKLEYTMKQTFIYHDFVYPFLKIPRRGAMYSSSHFHCDYRKCKKITHYHFLFAVFALIALFSTAANAQIITTIAGNGSMGYSGDGSPATNAQLNQPAGLVLDRHGNIYFSDFGNHRIRRIDNNGIIHPFAGIATYGFSGDGGPATDAQLYDAEGLAIDTIGNIYLADNNNFRIRKIDTLGFIGTVAGSGSAFFTTDGIPATSEGMDPFDVAFDNSGNMYIVDAHSRITKVMSGILSTVAGNGISGFSGDGFAATLAQIKQASGIALDAQGNLFIADEFNSRVRKVDTHGIITTFAGTGTPGYGGDGGPANAAEIAYPSDIATDGCGNLYIADYNNVRIRKVDAAGTITTIAGNGTIGYTGDGGPATAAVLGGPDFIKADAYMNIYFSDLSNNVIRRISTANHPPAFTSGHVWSITVCNTAVLSLDTMLTAIDPDTLQSETWSIIKNPAHGAVTGAYSAMSTGGAVTPSGLAYTPATGFTGHDTLEIRIGDCGNAADTMTVYFTVADCALGIAAAVQPDELQLSPNPNNGSFTITLNSSSYEPALLTISNMVGEKILEQATTTNIPVQVNLTAPTGIYFVKMSTKQGSSNAKMIIMRE